MMLPPKSGRKAVRLRNASTMSQLAFLYSDIMAAWISNEPAHPSPRDAHSHFLPGMRKKVLALAAQIQAVKMQIPIARYEGSIRGAWPGDEYLKLANVQSDMRSSMALVGFFLRESV